MLNIKFSQDGHFSWSRDCPRHYIYLYTVSHSITPIRYDFLAGHFHRVLNGLLRRMWLVDNDTVFVRNRSIVHGARSSVQRRDGSGDVVFAGQPSPAGVDGADAVVRLEHRRASGSDRKRCRI